MELKLYTYTFNNNWNELKIFATIAAKSRLDAICLLLDEARRNENYLYNTINDYSISNYTGDANEDLVEESGVFISEAERVISFNYMYAGW